MTKCSLFAVCLSLGTCVAYAQAVRVVDEDGIPVRHFEAMYHTADDGYGRWERGREGVWSLPRHLTRDPAVIDILVRADGYATTVQRFEHQAKETLLQGAAVISMEKGREILLQLNLPPGMPLPDAFLPQVYFSEFAWRVRMMWQPVNQRNGQPDFNLLNVKSREAGGFWLRLPENSVEFYVAFQHPGWLRFYEAGPFTNDDIVNGTLTLDVPRPASVEVRFDTGGREADSLPFAEVYCDIMWQNPNAGSSMYSVNHKDRTLEDGIFRITGLGPGTYIVRLSTKPKETVKQIENTEINPGRFFDQRKVEARAGQTAKEVISFVPFDVNANVGSGKARISVLLPNDQPAAGKLLKIHWYDGHYGSLVIFDRPVPDDGIVHLNGISQKAYDTPFGPYSVSVDDESVGFFRLKVTNDIQDFQFRIAPGVGDVAPDFPLVNIQTGEKCRLADFRGKIILVEFWATWCGPCQPTMSKLAELFAVNEAEWKDQVVIVPLSTDDSIDRAAKHIASRGWGTMPQYWAKREGDEYFTTAQLAYVVHGIPHAILIDSSGKIAWRGHPMRAGDGTDIVERIRALQTP